MAQEVGKGGDEDKVQSLEETKRLFLTWYSTENRELESRSKLRACRVAISRNCFQRRKIVLCVSSENINTTTCQEQASCNKRRAENSNKSPRIP
jgi:hypothetical protein